MVTQQPTQRQDHLIAELRSTEAQIASLNKRRRDLREELELIYPEARILSPPPPIKGTPITVWNYQTLNYTARVTITPKGTQALNDLNAALNTTQLTALALLLPRPNGADLTKLLNLPMIRDNSHPKRYIKRLHEDHFIHVDFTPIEVKLND
jgi:hypothetical protein